VGVELVERLRFYCPHLVPPASYYPALTSALRSDLVLLLGAYERGQGLVVKCKDG
jgi:hypothetical protein